MNVMKLCKYCNEYYPESDFGVAGTIRNKVYRRLKCRYCFNNDKKLLKAKYQKFLNDYKDFCPCDILFDKKGSLKVEFK